MDEKLFYSIIDQLRAIDYNGYISLFSNNEPLLDKRILKFVEYAKNNLPHAKHHIYTNGILLDREKFLLLAKNLDQMIIDNYDDDDKMMPHLKEIIESDLPDDINCNVTVSMRKKNQKLNTRGSKAPNRLNEEKFHSHSACILPFSQMIIRPNGTLAKCCNDPLDDIVLGDLNKQSIREAWRGKIYSEFRKAMYYGERGNIPGCDFCDIFGLYNYLPDYAKTNEFSRIVEEIQFHKKLGKVYIFDTNPVSKNLYSMLMAMHVVADGIINVRNEPAEQNLNCVTLEQVMAEKDFIVIPTPYYDDNLFDFFEANNYKYGKDYLICSPDF